MSVRYVGVQWNRFNLAYDVAMALGIGGVVLFLESVARSQLAAAGDGLSEPVRHMRAFGTCAFVLLSLILCIGPLARLDQRFLPLVYNRRHLGVALCAVAVVHAYHVLGFYHAYSNVPRFVSLLRYDAAFTSASLPFQLFGAAALLILLLMAATSHDFWQRFLGPSAWKSLHMLVYAAYALIVLHVAFGALQIERRPGFTLFFLGAVALVCTLHVLAARRSNAADRAGSRSEETDGVRWLDAGLARDIPVDRARPLVVPGGERIAVVRSGDAISAVHGVCAHQGGPLYEGKVIDGCLTCPWHGWQYRPSDGCSPPPFQERLITYRLRLKDGRVLVDPRPLPAGTAVPPVVLEGESDHD
jgi:DMSO/TMAO reductase YedYZ heme-binding membrane subunit/nitrite reductase/ring-hydroxylating ferredoxin subunit